MFFLGGHTVFRFIPQIPAAEQMADNTRYIECAFGLLCNTPLPCNHSASWEILVSKRHIIGYTDDGQPTVQIPVRISIGFLFCLFVIRICSLILLHNFINFNRFCSGFIIHWAMALHCYGYFSKQSLTVNNRKRIYGSIAFDSGKTFENISSANSHKIQSNRNVPFENWCRCWNNVNFNGFEIVANIWWKI